MRRKWSVASIALVLFAASVAAAQPGSDRVREDPGNQRGVMQQQQRAQWLTEQIDQWKLHQKVLIEQLREIHALAKEEGASDTANRVEKLISTQQESFRVRLGQLEQQQQRSMRALRQRGDRPNRPDRPERRGRRAPDVELQSFDGRTYKLSDLEGRIVVLEWFNMECPFVRYHHETKSTMVDLANKYQDKEVVWLAVNSTSNTDPQTNLDFAKEHELPYPIIDDRAGRIGRAFGARTTPHVFVIDKEGVVVYQGAIDNAPMGKVEANAATINYVDQAISQLLTDQQVTTPATPPYGCSVKYDSGR